MIASWRGFVVLITIATALGVVLLLWPPRASHESRAIGELPANVTELTITHGAETLTFKSTAAGWVSTQPRIVAEHTVIDALTDTARAATWHRKAPASAAGAVRGSVSLHGDTDLTFAIGQELPGAAQTWIIRDHHALLVDTWVVHALWPDALHLRRRFPFDAAGTGGAIVAGAVRLVGTLREVPTGAQWLDATRVRELVDAMTALELVSLDGITPGTTGAPIRLERPSGDVTATPAGTCAGGRIFLSITTGDGCVEAAAWQRVAGAAAALEQPLEQIAELRPVPFKPDRVRFAEADLDLSGRPRIGNDDADPARVEELLAALATPATLIRRRPTGEAPSIKVFAPDGLVVQLTLYADSIVRNGEPIALVLDPAALAIIKRPPSALRDPVLWHEDVTTLTSLTIDGVTYQRGAVIGEWSRPTGTADAALVDALAETLASVRAPAGPAPTVAHRISVTFTPPAGPPTSHTLELGAPEAGGCAARVDRAPVRLDLPLCTAAIALASAH